MHKLYDLKEMLCEELEEYGSKDNLDVGGLEIVDKLAHAIKNIDKIIEAYEESEYSSEGSYARGRGGNGGRNNRDTYRSYARGRGRNARRDNMGRYSRGYSMANEDMMDELRELMEKAPDEMTKREFRKFIDKIETM